jgi:uncharacterized iron-regulated membrane protein
VVAIVRGVLVLLHRWAGLAMAGFLIVVGLTGSLLAFYAELNHWLAPDVWPARVTGRPLAHLIHDGAVRRLASVA